MFGKVNRYIENVLLIINLVEFHFFYQIHIPRINIWLFLNVCACLCISVLYVCESVCVNACVLMRVSVWICVSICVWECVYLRERERKTSNSSELSILNMRQRGLLMMKHLPKRRKREKEKGYYQRNRNECLISRPDIWRTTEKTK